MIQQAFREPGGIEERIGAVHKFVRLPEVRLQRHAALAEADVVHPAGRPDLEPVKAGREVDRAIELAVFRRDGAAIDGEQELGRIGDGRVGALGDGEIPEVQAEAAGHLRPFVEVSAEAVDHGGNVVAVLAFPFHILKDAPGHRRARAGDIGCEALGKFLGGPAAPHVLRQLAEIMDLAAAARVVAVGVVDDSHGGLPGFLRGGQIRGESGDGLHFLLVHARLEEEFLEFRAGFLCGDRQLAERDVVVEVDAEFGSRSHLVGDGTPCGVGGGVRADDHVRVAARFGILGEGEGLGAGGRDAALEPTGVGARFLERDLGNRIAAGTRNAGDELVDAAGAAAVGIDHADMDGVAGLGDIGEVAPEFRFGRAIALLARLGTERPGGHLRSGGGGHIAIHLALDLLHERLHVGGALLGFREELAGGGHQHRIGSDRDRPAAFLLDVVHLFAEALRIGVEDLVVSDHLEDVVTGIGRAEGGGHLAAEFRFLVPELAEEKLLLVAGCGPDDDLDLGACAGDGESGIGERHLELFAGDEGFLAGGGAELNLGGLHEFLALELDFPQKDLGVRVVGLAGEDGVDVVLGVVEFLHVEVDLGAGVAGVGPDLGDALELEVVEGLEGSVEVLGDALGGGLAEGGLEADGELRVGRIGLGAGVDFMGLAELAALHGDVSVGDVDPGFLKRSERASRLAGPAEEGLDEGFLAGFVTAVDRALERPHEIGYRELAMGGKEGIPAFIEKGPRAVFVARNPVGLRLVNGIRRVVLGHRDGNQSQLHRRLAQQGFHLWKTLLGLKTIAVPGTCQGIHAPACEGIGRVGVLIHQGFDEIPHRLEHRTWIDLTDIRPEIARRLLQHQRITQLTDLREDAFDHLVALAGLANIVRNPEDEAKNLGIGENGFIQVGNLFRCVDLEPDR